MVSIIGTRFSRTCM